MFALLDWTRNKRKEYQIKEGLTNDLLFNAGITWSEINYLDNFFPPISPTPVVPVLPANPTPGIIISGTPSPASIVKEISVVRAAGMPDSPKIPPPSNPASISINNDGNIPVVRTAGMPYSPTPSSASIVKEIPVVRPAGIPYSPARSPAYAPTPSYAPTPAYAPSYVAKTPAPAYVTPAPLIYNLPSPSTKSSGLPGVSPGVSPRQTQLCETAYADFKSKVAAFYGTPNADYTRAGSGDWVIELPTKDNICKDLGSFLVSFNSGVNIEKIMFYSNLNQDTRYDGCDKELLTKIEGLNLTTVPDLSVIPPCIFVYISDDQFNSLSKSQFGTITLPQVTALLNRRTYLYPLNEINEIPIWQRKMVPPLEKWENSSTEIKNIIQKNDEIINLNTVLSGLYFTVSTDATEQSRNPNHIWMIGTPKTAADAQNSIRPPPVGDAKQPINGNSGDNTLIPPSSIRLYKDYDYKGDYIEFPSYGRFGKIIYNFSPYVGIKLGSDIKSVNFKPTDYNEKGGDWSATDTPLFSFTKDTPNIKTITPELGGYMWILGGTVSKMPSAWVPTNQIV